MISKVSLLFLVLLFIGLFCYYPRVDGFLSKEEVGSRENHDSDRVTLERQLKFLNKHPIKTINVENGDTFDCVDIHNQPALDHLLLKNHKIQMRPNFRPKSVNGNTKTFPSVQKAKYWRKSSTAFKPLDCPEGTVPIRRTTKEDLIRAKPFFESYTSSSTSTLQAIEHVAIRRSKNSNNETYNGVFGWIDLANPSYILNDQFSAAQLWVEGGPLHKITTLQAGWIVSPQLFKDNKTRLFGYSNSDVNPQGCYNLLCQGFVQTNKDIAFGLEFTPSTHAEEQRILVVQIYKANDSGSWWLGIGASVHDIKDMGYWPGEIYNELVGGASYVAWGGRVQANPKGQSPNMGNGYAPHGSNFQRNVCSVMQLQVIYSNFTFVPPNESAFENFVDSKICYGLEYSGNLEKSGLGYSFMFGGPGGNNCGINKGRIKLMYMCMPHK